jgi:hypothetical protein
MQKRIFWSWNVHESMDILLFRYCNHNPSTLAEILRLDNSFIIPYNETTFRNTKRPNDS